MITQEGINEIERDIKMSLENCACLGSQAYGNYIDKLTKGIMNKIKIKNNNE